MSLIGKMISSLKIIIFLSLLVFTGLLLADDFGQSLIGQTIENDLEQVYKEIEEESVYVTGRQKDLLKKSEEEEDEKDNSPFLMGAPKDYMESSKLGSVQDPGVTTVGAFANSTEYLEHDLSKMTYQNEMRGKNALAINYFRDTYEYKDPRGIFDTVYRDDPKSYNAGTLQIGYDFFLSKGDYTDLYLGTKFGFGYNEGPGVFVYSREVSDSRFRLITVPLDLAFGFSLRPGKWLKLSFDGGPTGMGLYQTRTDRASGERGKRRRQFGYGFYGQGVMKLSISNIFPNYFQRLYYSMSITKVWLNLLARYQNVSNFQDELTISGASFGVGFTCESF